MTDDTLRKTPLHEQHLEAGARMVGFAGWDMPVQYSGVIEEHRAVRQAAGLFDVSHMGEIRVRGSDAEAFLDRLIAISGVDPEVREDPSKVRPIDLPLRQADNTRLCQLGWQQQRDLDQALQDLWNATRSQVEGEADAGGVPST